MLSPSCTHIVVHICGPLRAPTLDFVVAQVRLDAVDVDRARGRTALDSCLCALIKEPDHVLVYFLKEVVD